VASQTKERDRTLTDKKITVAIMCYGLHGYEYRSAEEMEGLIDYLLYSCADYIAKLYQQKRLSGVVLCGGYTNKAYPDKSEAGTSLPHLQNALRTLHKIDPADIVFCLEEESCNTAQNIAFTGYRMTHKHKLSVGNFFKGFTITDNAYPIALMSPEKDQWQNLSRNVVFICDKYRQLKVWVMLRLAGGLLSGFIVPAESPFCLQIKSFPRKDIHPNSSYRKQWAAALYYLRHRDKFFEDLTQAPAR